MSSLGRKCAQKSQALRAGLRGQRRPQPGRRSGFAASAPPPGRLFQPRLGFEAARPGDEEGGRKGTSACGFYQDVGEAPRRATGGTWGPGNGST